MAFSGKPESPQVPLFTYITVPLKPARKSDSTDDAHSDVLDNKLQEETGKMPLVAECVPPSTSIKREKKLAAHERGQCNPCAYFWQKEDGCRQGDDCEFCHLCDKDAMRRWKKEKKQRKKAEALAAEKNVGNGKKNKRSVSKSTSKVSTVIGDPVRVNLAECSGLSSSSSNLGMFPYLPMELRVTPYQVRTSSLDLEKSAVTHADMSPKLVESFTDPGGPFGSTASVDPFSSGPAGSLGSVFAGETLKATQDETAPYRPLRLYDMWPELTDSRK